MQIVTYSEMKAFKECRRKWELSFRKMYAPKQEPDYFKDGRCMHKALETYYKYTGESSGQQQEQALLTLRITISEAYDNTWLEYEKESHYNLLEAMLENYFEFAAENDSFTPIHLEREFMIPVKDDLVLAGRVDGLVKNDGLWLLEFKTAKDISPAYINFLQKDSQITCYVYAMSREDPEIQGVLYTILRKRKRSKSPLIVRTKVLRDIEQLDAFHNEIITIAAEMWKGVIYKSQSQWNCAYCAYSAICDREDAEVIDYEYRVKDRKHEELSYE